MPEPVTAAEFERWMRHLDEHLQRLSEQQKTTNGRVTELEINYRVVKRFTTWMSGIAAIVVSGFVSWATTSFLR